MRALRDPPTYDVRRSTGLWLGFALALPVPVLALASSCPPWVDLIALLSPFAWAVTLGALGRVSQLADLEHFATASAYPTAECSHAAECSALRGMANSEKAGRERLEALQSLADAELELAQQVHRSLLPEEVHRPDLSVLVRQIPCAYVGGDYLHAALPRPDLLYLCVGDVCGHGVSAALVVSRIHGLVQRLVREERAPEEVLEELHRFTMEVLRHTHLFLTFAVFRVDLSARRIEYATAGHPSQFLLRGDGSVESLATPNGILGTAPGGGRKPLESGSAGYGEGDTLVLFTDGLFEVVARDGGRLLGESGIRLGLRALAARPPSVVASEILRHVTEFGRPGPFEDDVSLLIARFGPVPAEPRTAPSHEAAVR